jgi:glycosyltransferase involved in cell wall biosynthesis
VDCDSWYPIAALLGSPTPTVPFVTIALGVRYHRKQLGMTTDDLSKNSAHIQRLCFERFVGSSGVGYVLTPEETLSEFYQQRARARLRYIPDLAELPNLMDKGEARRKLGLTETAQVLLSYGSLSKRKGIQQLLDLLSDKQCPPRVVALIAGEADLQTTALLHSEAAETLRTRGRLHWIGGFLDVEDMATKLVFSGADVAWLGYRDFYKSSAFLWQASLAGLPIIGCRDGLIGHLVDRHELGLTVDPNDHKEVFSAVDALMNDHRRRCQIVANCLQEGAKHLPSHFGATVCDALASCAPVVKGGLSS